MSAIQENSEQCEGIPFYDLTKRVCRRHNILAAIAQNRQDHAHVVEMRDEYAKLAQVLESQHAVLRKNLVDV